VQLLTLTTDRESKYRWTVVSAGNTSEDLPRLRKTAENTERYRQGVPGGKVNILGGHNIGNSKQKCLYEHVSYSERFPR